MKNVLEHPKVCWKNVLECPKNVEKKLKKKLKIKSKKSEDSFSPLFELLLFLFSLSNVKTGNSLALKFRYSEKATIFLKKSSILFRRYQVIFLERWEIFSNFVVFSPYLNINFQNLFWKLRKTFLTNSLYKEGTRLKGAHGETVVKKKSVKDSFFYDRLSWQWYNLTFYLDIFASFHQTGALY